MSDRDPQRLSAADVLLLAAVTLALLAPGIGVSLVDRDEGWYAQIVREMRSTGNWLVPHYLGKVWLGKPPLLYWLIGLSTRLLGWGEWQARLIPLIASVANVLLVACLAARLFNRRVGLWAGMIFATFGMSVVIGKLLIADSLVLTFILLTVLLQHRMATDGVTHIRAALHGLVVGLGLLAKGPVILIFGGAFAIALLAVDRRGWRRWLGNWRWWVWGTLALVVGVPWYVYIYHVDPVTFRDQFITYEMTSRFTRSHGGQPGMPGVYVLMSIVCLLPWTAFVPAALSDAIHRRRENGTYPLLLIWLVLPWILLELLKAKALNYTLPCYVPIAILLAATLTRWFEPASASAGPRQLIDAPAPAHRWTFRLVWLPMSIFGVCIMLLYKGCLANTWGQTAMAVGMVTLAGFLGVNLIARKFGFAAGCKAILAATIATHATAGLLFYPSLEPSRFSRNVANAINAEVRPGERVILCGYKEPTLYVYAHPSIQTIQPGELSGLLAATQPASPILLAISQPDLDQLAAIAPAMAQSVKSHILREITGYNHIKTRLKIGPNGWIKPWQERIHLARIGA